MARKVLNRKALREEADAAEAVAKTAKGKGEPKAGTEAKVKKPPAKRKSRAKEPVEVRMKLFWGVFNQGMKCIAKYDFMHKKAAEQKATELSASGKSPHFVQKMKEAIQD
jgi:hypothetical protein